MPSPALITRGAVARLAGRLRFPYLLLVTAILFLIDLAVPDIVPMVDEILLGLGTLVLATWRRRKEEGDGDGGEAGRQDTPSPK